MDKELDGRVALITGCGSPGGIGMACARTFAREGARLAITSTTDRIHERVTELREGGTDVESGVADLTDRRRVEELVGAVAHHYGTIDIVVNNAGMMNLGLEDFSFDRFVDMDPATWTWRSR
jgi:3-oxoacyl-[acyl-carrier protein] reductase